MKKKMSIMVAMLLAVLLLATACAPAAPDAPVAPDAPAAPDTPAEADTPTAEPEAPVAPEPAPAAPGDVRGRTDMAIAMFSGYEPLQTEYHFSFVYALIHPWFEAIEVGIVDAIADYAEFMGVTITYDFVAPIHPDPLAQVEMVEQLAALSPDLIGIDVSQPEVLVPVINEIMARGIPVMTFSGGDAGREVGSNRVAFVGNTDNFGDGAALARALFEAMGGEGEVARLDGTLGQPNHEARIEGFYSVLEEFPGITVVDMQRDEDDLEQAILQTEGFLQRHPNLRGIWANNMTNPIGAAVAVEAAGRQDDIIIVGMDHDRRALEFLNTGVIYALGIQNNYDMGYLLIEKALRIADGVEVEELTGTGSTIIFQNRAQEFIDLLF